MHRGELVRHKPSARTSDYTAKRCYANDGCSLAEHFAHDLARAGFVIVSGLASGIDTAAHRGAIKAGGQTIAVVATGIDTTYPCSNRSLCEEIVKNGALVSQFLPTSAPKKHHFPRRNRTLSGLSLATVFIEAGVPSGTLITATAAAEQGRDVIALPWSVNHRGGRGCLELLMNGALLALNLLMQLAQSIGRIVISRYPIWMRPLSKTLRTLEL